MPETQTAVEQKPSAVPPAAPVNGSKGPPKRVLIVVGLIAAAALVAGGRMWYHSHYFVETDNAYVAGHVHAVSTRIPGVVPRVMFADTQMVTAAAVPVELDQAAQPVK